jgi:hypothetical protein
MKTTSTMIEQYNQYFIKGLNEKCIAAKTLFEKLHLLQLLSSSEQHSIIKNVCKNLLNAHMEYNNFYNEPLFAERLLEITSSMNTPETIQNELVYTVLMCYVGNPYLSTILWYLDLKSRAKVDKSGFFRLQLY